MGEKGRLSGEGGGIERGRRPLGGNHVDYVNSGSFGEEESESED